MGAVLLGLLVACGGSGGSRYEEYGVDADAAADAAQEAGEEARQAVYEEYGAGGDGIGADANNVDAQDVEDQGDYVCTEDCSGHEAGFAWAQDNDFTDAADCGGNSQSFIEGCEAFANARQEQADREAQEAAEQASEDASYEAETEPEYEAEY